VKVLAKAKTQDEKRLERLENLGFKPIDIGGEIEKWDEEGREVEGIFIEKRPGELGTLIDIKVDDTVKTFSCPTILNRMTGPFSKGDGIYIYYIGEVEGKRGRSYKMFAVFQKSPEEKLPY
jgi:hypothetical protein